MIYHLLPVWEIFSAYRGTAIPLGVANLMRLDPSVAVVCQSADSTWEIDPARIIVIPGLRAYAKMRGGKLLPLWITRPLLSRVFQPLLMRLKNNDVVWCHNDSALAAALAPSIKLKCAKLIYHFHDANEIHGMRNTFRSFTPAAYFFVSEATRQQWIQRFPWLENTFAVHNGADETLFFPPSSEQKQNHPTPTVLYVGRLVPEKGVHVLVEAMRILQTRNVNVVCRIVGSSRAGGSKSTRYVRSLLKTSPPNVCFVPHLSVTQIPEEYRAADMLCCPSICQDALPNVVIEALACGVPVVATRVGGVPEIAADGGVLLVAPDRAIELANKLQQLIQNEDLRAVTAAEGLQSSRKRFTSKAADERFKEVLETL